ncbi:AAA family ATPase [Methanothrix sp.]|uniref:AAA family ATPase n=1 Tax=Methanothrix sp. TaxID=90426 RepID=UPI003BAF639E
MSEAPRSSRRIANKIIPINRLRSYAISNGCNIADELFLNNKGGVGKRSQVHHLTWMYADLGLKALPSDIDSQANLTASFLDEEELEEFWPDGDHSKSICGSLDPLLCGVRRYCRGSPCRGDR